MFYKKILMVSTVIFSSYMLSACSATQGYRASYNQNTYQQIPQIQPQIAFISEKTSTLPPYGYVQFCRDNPTECIDQNISNPQSSVLNNEITASTTAHTSTASISAADSLNPFNLSHNLRRLISNNPQEKQQFNNIIALLDSVNRNVNNNVTQVTDMDGFGVAENWRLPDVNSFVGDIGDCEDFALAKRKILIENYGFNRNALSMSVLRRPQGDVHAVLMVRTAYGDYVLDNLERDVLPWHKTGYQWLKKQAFGKPNQWVSL
jgi:predicted transglutaminase-like cysteine proteinase